MSLVTREALYEKLNDADRNITSPVEVRKAIIELLTALLEQQGFNVSAFMPEIGIDAIAVKPAADDATPYNIGCQINYYPNLYPVGVREIRDLVLSPVWPSLNKLLITARAGFTTGATTTARQAAGREIELLDFLALHSWIDRAFPQDSAQRHKVELMLKTLSRQLAHVVARDPNALDYLEWRDVERLLAEVFEGLGFKTELTPPSKDGGKDLILQCRVSGAAHSYIVEVKHWRSGKHVGPTAVREFLTVLTEEQRQGGLYLSTYGYAPNAFEILTQVERKHLKFGAKEKVWGLCQQYERINSTIWLPVDNLVEILFEETI